eukprot:tig00020710_g13306.t1
MACSECGTWPTDDEIQRGVAFCCYSCGARCHLHCHGVRFYEQAEIAHFACKQCQHQRGLQHKRRTIEPHLNLGPPTHANANAGTYPPRGHQPEARASVPLAAASSPVYQPAWHQQPAAFAPSPAAGNWPAAQLQQQAPPRTAAAPPAARYPPPPPQQQQPQQPYAYQEAFSSVPAPSGFGPPPQRWQTAPAPAQPPRVATAPAPAAAVAVRSGFSSHANGGPPPSAGAPVPPGKLPIAPVRRAPPPVAPAPVVRKTQPVRIYPRPPPAPKPTPLDEVVLSAPDFQPPPRSWPPLEPTPARPRPRPGPRAVRTTRAREIGADPARRLGRAAAPVPIQFDDDPEEEDEDEDEDDEEDYVEGGGRKRRAPAPAPKLTWDDTKKRKRRPQSTSDPLAANRKKKQQQAAKRKAARAAAAKAAPAPAEAPAADGEASEAAPGVGEGSGEAAASPPPPPPAASPTAKKEKGTPKAGSGRRGRPRGRASSPSAAAPRSPSPPFEPLFLGTLLLKVPNLSPRELLEAVQEARAAAAAPAIPPGKARGRRSGQQALPDSDDEREKALPRNVRRYLDVANKYRSILEEARRVAKAGGDEEEAAAAAAAAAAAGPAPAQAPATTAAAPEAPSDASGAGPSAAAAGPSAPAAGPTRASAASCRPPSPPPPPGRLLFLRLRLRRRRWPSTPPPALPRASSSSAASTPRGAPPKRAPLPPPPRPEGLVTGGERSQARVLGIADAWQRLMEADSARAFTYNCAQNIIRVALFRLRRRGGPRWKPSKPYDPEKRAAAEEEARKASAEAEAGAGPGAGAGDEGMVSWPARVRAGEPLEVAFLRNRALFTVKEEEGEGGADGGAEGAPVREPVVGVATYRQVDVGGDLLAALRSAAASRLVRFEAVADPDDPAGPTRPVLRVHVRLWLLRRAFHEAAPAADLAKFPSLRALVTAVLAGPAGLAKPTPVGPGAGPASAPDADADAVTDLVAEEGTAAASAPATNLDLRSLYEAVRPRGGEEALQPEQLVPQLRPYQRRCLRWLLDRELGASVGSGPEAGPSSAPAVPLHPLWEEYRLPAAPEGGKEKAAAPEPGPILYLNRFTGRLSLTRFAAPAAPAPLPPDAEAAPDAVVPGGILADEMGLGKTVEVLALLVAHPRPRAAAAAARAAPAASPPSSSPSSPPPRSSSSASGPRPREILPPRDPPRYPAQDVAVYVPAPTPAGGGSGQAAVSSGYGVLLPGSGQPVPLSEEVADLLRQHNLLYRPTREKNVSGAGAGPVGRIPSGATLVVCPDAIREQWRAEARRHAPHLKLFVYEGLRSREGQAEAEAAEAGEATGKVETTPRKRRSSGKKSASGKKGGGGGEEGWGPEAAEEAAVRAEELAGCDLVLTTYTVLRSEVNYSQQADVLRALRFQKRYDVPESPLLALDWWRVILDEAQMVEGTTSQAARMAARIPARHRCLPAYLCVTGTPIGGRGLEDLYGLLLFLRHDPYAERFWWVNAVRRPYEMSHPRGIARLHALLRGAMWRHAKAHVLHEIELPPCHRRGDTARPAPPHLHCVDGRLDLRFTVPEREFYQRLVREAVSTVQVPALAQRSSEMS